jgi:precorrin-2/cobalt-factor-2 C20-methyltransferase
MQLGHLYSIGVGPGDVELLTLKALRILKEVPVIFVPKRDDKQESYAYNIVRELIDTRRQEVINLIFPMMKDEAKLRVYWQDAAATIWQRLAQGKDCAFITEGDPLFYGTFSYIHRIFQQHYPRVNTEIIPGISSVNAAAARAQTPLAQGDDRVAILASTPDNERLKQIICNFDTIVLMKVHNIPRVVTILEQLNLVDNFIYVQRCTAPAEEIIRDVRKLKENKSDYLSLVIIRK